MKNLYLLSTSFFCAAALNCFSLVPCAKAKTTSGKNHPSTSTNTKQEQVLVSEVVIRGVEGELQKEISKIIQVQAAKNTTRFQLQQDINAIFATDYLKNVQVIPEDTPVGVRVTFVVEPNPVLRKVKVKGSSVLSQKVINQSFSQQYGKILNLQEFQAGVKRLNQWYQDNGYVLAQAIDSPNITSDGTVTLEVAEGVVEDIQVQFVNEEGEEKDDGESRVQFGLGERF